VNGPSFRFRLERVRAVRERKEKLAQEALAQSISRLSDSQEGLRNAEAELEQALTGQREAAETGRPVGAAELQAAQAFLERMEAKQRHQEAVLQRNEADVAEDNRRLTIAAGEHEMLLRLRERRRGEHMREQARRESNLHDEIASLRFQGRVA
jgi:flagellar FliJ protein